MLLLKRLTSSLILAFLFSLAALVGAGIIMQRGGGIQRPSPLEQERILATGNHYAHELTRHYGAVIILTILGVSALAALVLAFSGILPWCREKASARPTRGAK